MKNTNINFDELHQKFFKHCPQCNERQFYNRKSYRNQAAKQNLICKKCTVVNKLKDRDARVHEETMKEHKTCSTCKESKTKDQYRLIYGTNKLQYDCNQCLKIKNQKVHREYYGTAYGRKKKNESEARRRRRNPITFMLHGARHRAKKAAFEFSITKEDVVIPDVCPVLGIPLIHGFETGKPSDNSPTIDRVDNSKGYTKNNIAIISRKANSLKSNGTLDEFIKIVHYMKSYLDK